MKRIRGLGLLHRAALPLQHHPAICLCVQRDIKKWLVIGHLAAPSIVFVEWLLNCLLCRNVQFSSFLSFYVVLVSGLSWRPVSLLSF
uniref:Uncharacterized protein n=1 Tax=Pyxicephalus adspersus TaxID=30357 RepID=A0AAV3B2G2_PYXAD|nr:TPA: hypothetical protein GDO54_007193 [Pyxicephalus adspersus]